MQFKRVISSNLKTPIFFCYMDNFNLVFEQTESSCYKFWHVNVGCRVALCSVASGLYLISVSPLISERFG